MSLPLDVGVVSPERRSWMRWGILAVALVVVELLGFALVL
jgi:hypothetical protein